VSLGSNFPPQRKPQKFSPRGLRLVPAYARRCGARSRAGSEPLPPLDCVKAPTLLSLHRLV